MSTWGARGAAASTARVVGLSALVAGGATVAVIGLPFVLFAYRAPRLHVVMETTEAIAAVLVGYLVYGRFRQTARSRELFLVLAMGSVAVANLVLSVIPAVVVRFPGEQQLSEWAPLGVRLLGTLLLVAAALMPGTATAGRRTVIPAVLSVLALMAVISAVGVLFADRLPPAVDPSVRLDQASRPLLVAHPLVTGTQALGAVLYAVAATAFARQAWRTTDELVRWVAAGCVFAAFSRVNYLLYPSLYTSLVYTGDVLRLGFYLCMLVGAAREIRSYWELRAQAAVMEDRRRLARDLHDGLTQELSYIFAQSRLLTATATAAGPTANHIEGAAGRALDEARRAIAALTRPIDEPFPVVLRQTLEELASRHDVKIVHDLDPATQVDTARAEALLRISGEAVRNAAHHSGCSRICVVSRAMPLTLEVRDDGVGFPADAPHGGNPHGFGLTSMRERAEAVGAEFSIVSAPGEGTTVRVSWP